MVDLVATFEPLVEAQAWDNIRGSLQSLPVSGKFVKPDTPPVLFTSYLVGSDKRLMDMTGVDKKKAAAIEKTRKDSGEMHAMMEGRRARG